MLKSYIKAIAGMFGKSVSENAFTRITEDKYHTYGVSQVLHKLSIEESALWMKNYIQEAVFLHKQRDMFDYAIENISHDYLNDDNLFLEFGVATGTSINHFAKKLQTKIYGFDSFEGLPDDWKGWNLKKGVFNRSGNMPAVESNVHLVKGLIEETLPVFLAQNPAKKIAFIHIDTDLYKPAKVILQLCKERLFPGSIILFDELHSYTSWQLHEYKALMEELPVDSYQFIAFSDYKQGLIRMIK